MLNPTRLASLGTLPLQGRDVRHLPYSPASLSVESTGAATMPQVYALVTGSLERSRWHDYYVMGVARRGFGQRFPLTP
jgi:hypothetical protein